MQHGNPSIYPHLTHLTTTRNTLKEIRLIEESMLEVYKRYKTELKLNNKQRTACFAHVNAARFAYNWGLARRIDAYEKTSKQPNAITQHKELNLLKKTDYPWLYKVSKCAPQEALRDLDYAYKRFFGGKCNFPRFKSRKSRKKSFRLTGVIKVFVQSIQLPRLGVLRLKERRYLPQNKHILSATILEKAGKWFVSLHVREKINVPENNGPLVGVDLGISTLAVVSDGTIYENPKPLLRYARKLRRVQRKLQRSKKQSKNRKKVIKKIQKIHYRMANIRKDSIHKSTTTLAKTKSVIGVENLSITAMYKNKYLRKGLVSTGLSTFLQTLEYKAKWYGSTLVFADKYFPSTKKCSSCDGVKEKIGIMTRIYNCQTCGLQIDRDLNASINLAALAASSAESLNAC